MAFENASCAYHWYGNFGEKFPSNGTGILMGTENRNGIELCHLQNTSDFSLSLDMKPGTSNPDKCYRKFRSFR